MLAVLTILPHLLQIMKAFGGEGLRMIDTTSS